MIGEYHRYIKLFPEGTRHKGRHYGTVGMYYVKARLFQLPEYLCVKGHARPVAHQLLCAEAGVAHHVKGVAVHGARVFRRHHGSLAQIFCGYYLSVIHHGVGHAVYHGWEGVVKQAYVYFIVHSASVRLL